jgi:hypothetical protein
LLPSEPGVPVLQFHFGRTGRAGISLTIITLAIESMVAELKFVLTSIEKFVGNEVLQGDVHMAATCSLC